MIFTVLSLSLLPALVAAQNVTTIQVAKTGLSFTPSTVTATTGDIINFVFDGPGHSVTQSTLADPCTPADGGFNSGFSTSAGEVWNLTITDTSKPIWFFCAQSKPAVHCLAGMVGAINPPSQDSFNTFVASASAAAVTPSITAVQLSGSGAVATASLTSVSGAASASASPTSPAASGSASGSSAPSSTPSSAAQMSLAGFESVFGLVLALIGAALF